MKKIDSCFNSQFKHLKCILINKKCEYYLVFYVFYDKIKALDIRINSYTSLYEALVIFERFPRNIGVYIGTFLLWYVGSGYF